MLILKLLLKLNFLTQSFTGAMSWNMLTGGVDPSSREVNRSLITPGILIVQWHRCAPLEPSSMNFHSTLDCKSSQAHGKTKMSFPVMDSSSEYPPFKFYSTTACTEDIKVARDAANAFISHLLSGHVWVGGRGIPWLLWIFLKGIPRHSLMRWHHLDLAPAESSGDTKQEITTKELCIQHSLMKWGIKSPPLSRHTLLGNGSGKLKKP